MRLTIAQLKNLLKEKKNKNLRTEKLVKKKKENPKDKEKKEKLLLANEQKLNEAKIKLSEISVDDQIDSLLIGFEKDSSKKEEFQTTYESRNFFDRVIDRILEEEGKLDTLDDVLPDEEKDKEADEKDVADPEDQTKDGSNIRAERPTEPQMPPLNIGHFAEKVSRLITNRDNLLDVKTVIFNRALRFVEENYNKEVSMKLEDILTTEYGIEKEIEYHKEMPTIYGKAAGPNIG